MITAFTAQITVLQGQVEAHFGRHPDGEIYRSQPGLGQILGAPVLGEFGDDPDRYDGARGAGHHAALRQLSNRLVGILHGCLKYRALYDETTAWAHHHKQDQQAAA